jgi:putative N6-adenine-specific DNA methylase
MRESLAAGVVMATGYDGTAPLVNPMCGSGTIAIEAALIAARRAPGLLRTNFGFTHLKCFDENLWRTIRNDAAKEGRKLAKKNRPARIIATDISPDAIVAAQKNAMTAGVEHLIDFSVCDFADTSIPDEKGIVVVNPEYGVRLGEIERLEDTYNRLGDFFKQKCPGWTCYIFTGNLALAKKVGLRTSRRTAFFNADIECRLLKYDMYEGRL